MKIQTSTYLRVLLIFPVVLISMGNKSCEEKDVKVETRELKRRVQMGAVKAPPIELPQGGVFNFQYVANAQLYDVLKKTQAFSTATIDPSKIYDPNGLSTEEAQVFNQCEDEEDVYYENPNGVSYKSTFSQVASCMIDMPQGIISGNILDFSLISKGGMSLKLTQIPFLSGGNFEFQKYELSLAMRAMHPLQRGGIVSGDKKIIATTSQEKVSKDYGVGLNLNFGGFELGPHVYYRTPLRKVVDDGLTSAIQDLKKQWNETEPWYAMVLRSCDKYIYINAGNKTDAGLKEGDILKIQNVTYRWESEACRSDLMGTIDYIGGPVGYARVVSVGDNISAAVILDRDPNYPYSRDQIIKPGARVYVEKLIENQVPQKIKK